MTKQKTRSNAVVLPSAHEEVPDFEHEKAVPATIGLAEAALILGIHKSTAWALYQAGTFPVPVLRVGTRIRVVKVHIQQFLETGQPVTFETATAAPVAFEPVTRRSNAG
jgi:predicted DNA-binding transcriptional regulator AlpA